MNVADSLNAIESELNSATHKFGAFHSYHEGVGVITEEMIELWLEIIANAPEDKIRRECIQVAAMALRFLIDLT